jgi:hypothetical protein
MTAPTEKASTESSEKKKTFYSYGKKPTDDKVATRLPVLTFRKGNYFHKFKMAL